MNTDFTKPRPWFGEINFLQNLLTKYKLTKLTAFAVHKTMDNN